MYGKVNNPTELTGWEFTYSRELIYMQYREKSTLNVFCLLNSGLVEVL